jgi:hypothetical protein
MMAAAAAEVVLLEGIGRGEVLDPLTGRAQPPTSAQIRTRIGEIRSGCPNGARAGMSQGLEVAAERTWGPECSRAWPSRLE